MGQVVRAEVHLIEEEEIECWTCEFCINNIFHNDVEFVNGHKVKYAFHKKCLVDANRMTGWFNRFWKRENERYNR